MTKLSVIIPVYNTEDYLPMCLDSVINQNIPDMEIIMVDDGSTDSSPEILERYAKANSNITVIRNDSNVGSGISRNNGLKIAKGEYIGFVDSDDWIDLNYYGTFLSIMEDTSADFAIAGICDEFNNSMSTKTRYAYYKPLEIDGRMAIRLLTKSENLGLWISPIMNNRVYRHDFIDNNNLTCASNKTWQDDYFSFFSMIYATRVLIVPGIRYHYRQQELSMTHSRTSSKSKIDDCLDVMKKIRTKLEADSIYDDYKNEYQSFVERNISSLLSMLKVNDYENSTDNLIYLFEKISSIYRIGDILNYLDNQRIYSFFGL